MKELGSYNYKRHIPEYVRVIAFNLGLTFQPNKGSSFYKLPPKDQIPVHQRGWDTPIGTLRLSDHWNYINNYDESVYNTNVHIPEGKWALCINAGASPAWRVLKIFYSNSTSMKIDFFRIKVIIENQIYNN